MAQIELNEKERFYIKAHLNPQQSENRVAGRKLDRIWDALKLDGVPDEVKLSDLGTVPSGFEMTSDERDGLIAYLDKQMSNAMGRVLWPVYDRAIKSRDG